MTQETFSSIANKLRKKDHSTVTYGCDLIAQEILHDEKLKNTISILIKKIEPS